MLYQCFSRNNNLDVVRTIDVFHGVKFISAPLKTNLHITKTQKQHQVGKDRSTLK